MSKLVLRIVSVSDDGADERVVMEHEVEKPDDDNYLPKLRLAFDGLLSDLALDTVSAIGFFSEWVKW